MKARDGSCILESREPSPCCILVVDFYNEGIDIQEMNTVLFLRPQESLTVFLQLLGRGLRLSEDKDCLTVLDFVDKPTATIRTKN